MFSPNQDRRKTPRYRNKQRIVRDIWLCSGTVMLLLPVGLIYVLALGTTFFAFMILDETP